MADKWGTAEFCNAEFEFNSACDNLLEDELVKRVTSKVAVLKGEITRSLVRARKKADEIAGHKARDDWQQSSAERIDQHRGRIY